MKPKSAKRTVRASLKATRKFVMQIGGRPTAASGAWHEKGDGRVPGRFRIETKCPPTGKYRMTFTEWDKLWKIATRANETPVFHLKLASQEIVLIREIDYIGFGGAETEVAYLMPALGHMIDYFMWVQLRMTHRHLSLILKGPRDVQLRAMPYQDFIAISERSA